MRVVVDWDGTVTDRDMLDAVLTEFGDPEIYAAVEADLGRTLTLNEVIAREFATVRAPLDEVVRWVGAEARIRPGFRELAAKHRPLVVSSGFHELIEPVLARERLDLEVRANRLDPSPDGWRVAFRNADVCDHCGEACKRCELPDGEVVFVGDGYADRCAALAADRVFATNGLADYLRVRGTPFEPFRDFYDVMRVLSTPPAPQAAP